MTAAALVNKLRARGVELITDGSRLGVRPAGVLTAEEREELRHRKAEVLELLKPTPASARPGSRYAHPWPDSLGGLGPRTVDAFAPCDGPCGTWSWVRYGVTALCLPCALQVEARAR